MHELLDQIANELRLIAQDLKKGEEPFNVAHGNGNFFGGSRVDLGDMASGIADAIETRGTDDLKGRKSQISSLLKGLEFIRVHTVPNLWGNPALVPAYIATMLNAERSLAPILKPETQVVPQIRSAQKRLRALEATLDGLHPRTEALSEKLTTIEEAHDAADMLPVDLRTLQEAREEIEIIKDHISRDQSEIRNISEFMRATKDDIHVLLQGLREADGEAKAIVGRCDSAYRVATSQGLAAAFADRSKRLDRSTWVWVGGLIAALVMGAWYGGLQIQTLIRELGSGQNADSEVYSRLLLAVLGVGGPIWFSWLATKQIGQRFRLSEDYAFKASVSRAYEGYRREAARVDTDLEIKLLESALSRLDEQPLRLVETNTYGSPWHELIASDAFRKAISGVPQFSSDVIDLAKTRLSTKRFANTSSETTGRNEEIA